jgi:hypothetical protein
MEWQGEILNGTDSLEFLHDSIGCGQLKYSLIDGKALGDPSLALLEKVDSEWNPTALSAYHHGSFL